MAEIYEGTKFNYIENLKASPKHALLNELKKWCRVFDEYKYAPSFAGGSSGNLSFRINPGSDQFIITCSHTSLSKSMADSDFSEIIDCSISDNEIKANGHRSPSSESFLHYLIYLKRPDINAVFHGHSNEIMYYAEKLKIPVTIKELPYGTIELAQDTSDLLKNNNFVIIKNHGFISAGKTLKVAGKRILDIENSIL